MADCAENCPLSEWQSPLATRSSARQRQRRTRQAIESTEPKPMTAGLLSTAPARQTRPSLLDDMLLLPMWTDHVLPCLTPKDAVRLSHVSRDWRVVHSSDGVWEPYLRPVAEGVLLTRVRQSGSLPFLGKTLMHAYMAASRHRCATCHRAWAGRVNLLTLEPSCWSCFTTWANANLMCKTKAVAHYLLTSKEAARLPFVLVGDDTKPLSSAKFVSRQHAQRLAAARYPNGLQGLEHDRQWRRAEAERRRQDSIRRYHIRHEQAVRSGGLLKIPAFPKPSPLLTDEGDRDVGLSTKCVLRRRWVLCSAGYFRKNDPRRALRDGETPEDFYYCRLCQESCGQPEWMMPQYPSPADLRTQHHHIECPHFYCDSMDEDSLDGYSDDDMHSGYYDTDEFMMMEGGGY